MFTGQVNLVRIAAIYFHLLRLSGEAVLRRCAHRLHVRLPSDLGWELQKIVANGIRVTFLFAKGEPGIPLLELQAGSMVSKLGGRCRVRIVDSGDHIFSRRAPRSIMESVLSEELFERAADQRGGGILFSTAAESAGGITRTRGHRGASGGREVRF
jgi:hypothetical protein